MPSSRNAVLIAWFIGMCVLIESVLVGPIAEHGAGHGGSAMVGLLAWLSGWNFHRPPAVNKHHQQA